MREIYGDFNTAEMKAKLEQILGLEVPQPPRSSAVPK